MISGVWTMAFQFALQMWIPHRHVNGLVCAPVTSSKMYDNYLLYELPSFGMMYWLCMSCRQTVDRHAMSTYTAIFLCTDTML